MIRTVVYFTDTVGFGGAEQALLTLIAGLNRHVWRPVLMYHPSPGITPLLQSATHQAVELWPVPRMPDGLEGARQLPQFIRGLQTRRPDIFHAHLTWPLACKFGLVGAIMARVPVIVVTVHLFVEFPLNLSIFVQQRLIAARVGRYLPVSHYVARRLHQTLGLPARKIRVIHNGVDIAQFDRSTHDAVRTELFEKEERPVVLTAARLDEQKGHRFLLEAATQVPEAQFILAGDGPLRASLEAQARSLGLEGRVRFLGYRTDIRDLLKRCDVFVLPSLYEGLPLSILEAMSTVKPVIATQIGGIDDAVIPGETGLLVPPGDPVALALAIRSVLADQPWARRLAFAGRARVEQCFSAEKMVQQVTNVYIELLSGHEASDERS